MAIMRVPANCRAGSENEISKFEDGEKSGTKFSFLKFRREKKFDIPGRKKHFERSILK